MDVHHLLLEGDAPQTPKQQQSKTQNHEEFGERDQAIQAGRELRVIVGADKIDDKQTENLSTEIAKKIQDEMTYPGQVKITVIRETRAVSYAK